LERVTTRRRRSKSATVAAVVWLGASFLGGCIPQNRVLLADIPLPPDITANAAENPEKWTRLSATDVVALARAQYGIGVGAHPVVRFLRLQGRLRDSPLTEGPVWIILSDNVPMGRGFGDEPTDRPATGLTWTFLSADGEFLGSSSMSDPRGVPTLPPP
jgi:hypothetical protein